MSQLPERSQLHQHLASIHTLSQRQGELSDQELWKIDCEHCSVDYRNVVDLCDERGLEIGVGPHGGTEGKLPYEVRVCQHLTTVHKSRYDNNNNVEKAFKAYVINTCCTQRLKIISVGMMTKCNGSKLGELHSVMIVFGRICTR